MADNIHQLSPALVSALQGLQSSLALVIALIDPTGQSARPLPPIPKTKSSAPTTAAALTQSAAVLSDWEDEIADFFSPTATATAKPPRDDEEAISIILADDVPPLLPSANKQPKLQPPPTPPTPSAPIRSEQPNKSPSSRRRPPPPTTVSETRPPPPNVRVPLSQPRKPVAVKPVATPAQPPPTQPQSSEAEVTSENRPPPPTQPQVAQPRTSEAQTERRRSPFWVPMPANASPAVAPPAPIESDLRQRIQRRRRRPMTCLVHMRQHTQRMGPFRLTVDDPLYFVELLEGLYLDLCNPPRWIERPTFFIRCDTAVQTWAKQLQRNDVYEILRRGQCLVDVVPPHYGHVELDAQLDLLESS